VLPSAQTDESLTTKNRLRREVKGVIQVPLYGLVHPEPHDKPDVVEAEPGRPCLLISAGSSSVRVVVPPRAGGLRIAATYARRLADAATTFADRCEQLQDESEAAQQGAPHNEKDN
jgi:hypothetical protein